MTRLTSNGIGQPLRNRQGKLAMIMKQELLDLEEARSFVDAHSILQAACYLDPPTDPAYWD